MDSVRKDFRIEFQCKKVLYRNAENNYTILNSSILKSESLLPQQKYIIVKGVFERIEEKDCFSAIGNWVDDKKYGLQLDVTAPIMTAPSDIEGIKRFLYRGVKGVGKKTASKIVNEYGIHSLEKIKESPDNISCIPGISKSKALRIHTTLINSDKIEALSVFLFKSGITSFNEVATIYDKMGDDAESKIIANPYSICDYISISKLPIADKIALSTGLSPLSEIRISKIIQHYLYSHGFESGDMYMILPYLYKTLPSYMKKNGFYYEEISKEWFEKILDYMLEFNLVNIEDGEEDKIIYLHSFYKIETETANIINKLNACSNTVLTQSVYDNFFKSYAEKTGIEADETQKLAVKMAYENKISVLTGGPGTGKTQTINTILSFLKKERPHAKIVLCAPTGRASKRVSELTGMEACTIHRLLGIMKDDDYGDAYNLELDADFVICDESSMIDAPLFYKLITAISNCKRASLLLVGDKDQLPPVGIGLPFKDIIESQKVPTVKLEKLYRQASKSQINRNAKMILSGVTHINDDGDTTKDGLTFDKSKQDFFLFETSDAVFQKELILKAIEQLLALGTLTMDDIMVLSPVNKTVLGVIELNNHIQEFINPLNNGVEYRNNLYSLRVNDRVMQTVNNYEMGVFNGDIGIITAIDTEDEEITVSYDDIYFKDGAVCHRKKEVIYSYSMAKELVLAYATTIHKSQGSEYPVAIIPISPMFYNMSRNILYTAITRCKKRCIMIGDRVSLANAIIKNDNINRRTKLAERLV